jgi:hypothetical protein
MFVVPAAWLLLRKREARALAAAAKPVSHP